MVGYRYCILRTGKDYSRSVAGSFNCWTTSPAPAMSSLDSENKYSTVQQVNHEGQKTLDESLTVSKLNKNMFNFKKFSFQQKCEG